MKVINPFTNRLAEVRKYYFRDLNNKLSLKYGFIYNYKFVEVQKVNDIIEILRVYERWEYKEAILCPK